MGYLGFVSLKLAANGVRIVETDNPKRTRLTAYTNRGQGVFLVLYALHDLGGSNAKADVIARISRGGWYDVTRHDLPPYEGKMEPKYHTLLAWARKDCYERDWMLPTDQKDDWSISRLGRAILEKSLSRYRTSEWDVRKCYLWKAVFEKLVDPRYVPSKDDAIRPEEILERYLELD